MKLFVTILMLLASLALTRAKPMFLDDTPKVVNGSMAALGDVPWQVTVQKGGRHWCGGSVLNENWIICAGHCVGAGSSDNPLYHSIVAGIISLDDAKNSSNSRKIDAIIRHRDYNGFEFSSDISLLHMQTPLVLDYTNPNVKAIQLPSQMNTGDPDPYIQAPWHAINNGTFEQAIQGSMFGISGWGTLKPGGQYPTDLMKTADPYISDKTCNEGDGTNGGYHGNVFETMICAGGVGEHHDTCQGDSGGPMNFIYNDTIISDKEYTISNEQVGIVSWGRSCANNGYPGVYTQLAFFTNWVMEATSCFENGNGAVACS